MSGYAPKLPLQTNGPQGYYNITNLQSLAKQNLKNLLLTNPGERIMLADFGVGLRNFLFEPNTIETRDIIRTTLIQQANKYLPYIDIGDIVIQDLSSAGNSPASVITLHINVNYFVIPLALPDELDVKLGNIISNTSDIIPGDSRTIVDVNTADIDYHTWVDKLKGGVSDEGKFKINF
tara:strand:+ start:174 stop:707 length:534 start_codon:yes stop_codon:yes gene_type:complete